MSSILIAIALAALLGVLFVAIVVIWYFSLWLQAACSGTRTGFLQLLAMSLRGVSPRTVVRCRIMAYQAGIEDIPEAELEAQFLAGGDIYSVTLALIAADRAGIELDWRTAAAIDLAGRDILDAVQLTVYPRVIDCPPRETTGKATLDGVARDGIQLQVRVRVTVRTNVGQLVGGATEATVVARVGEGIVSAIGTCSCYQEALTDPLLITRQVMAKRLDSHTAFSIVSIDIADMTVGANVGARLQADQAEADIRIARALAERRRAFAVAREQEMIALTQENQAAVILSEAEIPAAIAGAFRSGRLGDRRRFHHFSRRVHHPETNRRFGDRRLMTAASKTPLVDDG